MNSPLAVVDPDRSPSTCASVARVANPEIIGIIERRDEPCRRVADLEADSWEAVRCLSDFYCLYKVCRRSAKHRRARSFFTSLNLALKHLSPPAMDGKDFKDPLATQLYVMVTVN